MAAISWDTRGTRTDIRRRRLDQVNGPAAVGRRDADARNELEAAFRDIVEGGCHYEDVFFVGNEEYNGWKIANDLLGDRSIMPRHICEHLDLPQGSTYDGGARFVLANFTEA